MKVFREISVRHKGGLEMKALGWFGKKIDTPEKIRKRAGGIVLNNDRDIAVLYMSVPGLYILPGGGLDPGEDLLAGLHREIKEETGATVQVISALGYTVEYVEENQMRQESYFYLTEVVGKLEQPQFVEEEIQEGCELKWMTLDYLIELFRKQEADPEHIRERALGVLNEYKALLGD